MKTLTNSDVNCPKAGSEIFQGPFQRNLKTGAFHLAFCYRAIDNKQRSAQNPGAVKQQNSEQTKLSHPGQYAPGVS